MNVPPAKYEDLGLELLLYGLQSPVNIGLTLRIAETFFFQVSILDLCGVLEDAGKLATVGDFSCGAMSRRSWRRLGGTAALADLRSGRRFIATSIGKNATPLTEFQFFPGDLIALGNEYDGLPDDVTANADAQLRVPTPAIWLPKEKSHSPIDPRRTAGVARDGEPSLNVAVTAGIVCYAAYAQWLTRHGTEK